MKINHLSTRSQLPHMLRSCGQRQECLEKLSQSQVSILLYLRLCFFIAAQITQFAWPLRIALARQLEQSGQQ